MKTKSPNNPHPHKYTIADEDAVTTLMAKLAQKSQEAPQDIQKALDTAMEEYESANDEMRKAFFHGMLTGYGVALQVKRKNLAA